MTTAADPQIVPRQPASLPALRAADQGVADALEAVLSDNTRRVDAAQWRIFTDWCGDVDLRSLPAEPLTVASYLAARAGDGASIATLRLATSAIARAHQLAGHESPWMTWDHTGSPVSSPPTFTNSSSTAIGRQASSSPTIEPWTNGSTSSTTPSWTTAHWTNWPTLATR